MNSKTTWRLFLLAAALFAFIIFIERRAPDPGSALKPRVFANISAPAVTAIEIHQSNQVIRAEKTNDLWRLTTPPYPAQSTPIESLVENLTTLEKLGVISPSEVSAQTNKLAAFGLDVPAAKISITVGSNRHHLHLGGRVILSEQIYAQMAGSGEVILIDGSILKSIPPNPDPWRSPLLVHLAGRPYNHFQIRTRQRVTEFERDPTNQVWRIVKPTPARANHPRVALLLQKLETARVAQFITDSPAADLERYGLQTPELEFSYALDTNRIATFEFGASPTNDPASVYVRRSTSTNIVTVSRDLLEELNQPPKTFHDPQLISLDLNQLSQVRFGATNGFTVARMTNGLWQITEPAPMAADPDLMKSVLGNISNLEIIETAKDVPTDADLKQFGLAPPRFSLAFYAIRTNAAGALTNTLLTQIDFGTNRTVDTVFARRSDETPIYITQADEWIIPRNAWELRHRRVFNFAPTNVVSLTLSAGGVTNRLDRQATGWTADTVENEAIEETIFRMGRLLARRWISKDSSKLASFGFNQKSLSLEFGVQREGAVVPVGIVFGRQVGGFIYAATILPGEIEPTVFQYPGEDFEQLRQAFHLQPP